MPTLDKPGPIELELLAELGCKSTSTELVDGVQGFVKLGQGSFGKVLQARMAALGSDTVAVKLITVKSQSQWASAINEMMVLARARVRKSPYLMRSVAKEVCRPRRFEPSTLEESDEQTWVRFAVAMPCVPGSLRRYVLSQSRTATKTLRYLHQIACGLVNMAALFPDRPLMQIHNDVSAQSADGNLTVLQLKLDNILVSVQGAVVADFGFAGHDGWSGTQGYISPERKCSAAADVFSFGMIALCMM